MRRERTLDPEAFEVGMAAIKSQMDEIKADFAAVGLDYLKPTWKYTAEDRAKYEEIQRRSRERAVKGGK